MNTSIDLSTLFHKRQAESRSLSAENFQGKKGAGSIHQCMWDGIPWQARPGLWPTVPDIVGLALLQYH